MAAGSIIVDMLMRTGSFETDTARAAKSLDKLKKEVTKTAKEIGTVLGAAAVGATTALAFMVREAIEAAAEYQDLAEMTGATAEDLASMSVAASTAGVSMDSIGGSINKLTKSLVGVDDESKAAGAALVALGIKVEDFKRLDPVAQYEAIGKALAGYEDGAGKAAVAQALLGKSGAEQLKVFKALEEQGGRNVILTGEMIKKADEFADKAAANTQLVKLYAQSFAVQLLPAIGDVTMVVGDIIKQLLGLDKAANVLALNKAIAEWADDQAASIGLLAGKMESLALLAKALGKSFLPSSMGGAGRGQAWDDYFNFDESKYKKQLDAVRQARITAGIQGDPTELARRGRPPQSLPSLTFEGAGGKGSRGGGSKSSAPRSPDTYADDVAQAVGSAIRGSDVVQARELADQIEYLGKLYRETGLDAEIYQSALNKLRGGTNDADGALQEYIAHQEMLADLLGQTVSAKLEKQRTLLQAITQEYEKGTYGAVGSADAVKKYGEVVDVVLGRAGEQAEKTKSIAEDLGLTFSSAFEDAIVSGGKLSDVIKGLEQDILRMITRKMVTEPLGNFITNALKGAMGGGSGGGGFMSSIGNFFSSIFGGGRAAGGPVSAGGLYEVNERGAPEMLKMDGKEFLLMGNRRGWVDPNHSAGRSSGATWSPVFNMSFAAGTSVATATQAGAAVARRIQASAQRNG